MIFVTVGSQMPFDRLVQIVDGWAAEHPEREVVCQTGETDVVPTAMSVVREIAPDDFQRHVAEAEVVVSHAGMGTILTCLHLRTPLIMMPRRGSLGETRNDHQVDTCQRLGDRAGLHVAYEADQLCALLDRSDELTLAETAVGTTASPELIARVRDAIATGATRRRGRRPVWPRQKRAQRTQSTTER